MPVEGWLPDRPIALATAGTLFAVMLHLGLGIGPGRLCWVFRHPGLLLRALFSALVLVPVAAVVVVRRFDLPFAAEIGIVLMAIAPGAPVALRRSLDAGGHAAFAPALQVALALLAVATLPLSVALLDIFYAGRAVVEPVALAEQVFLAQLLPLGLGLACHAAFPARAAALAQRLDPWAKGLLLAFTVVMLVHVSPILAQARTGTVLAVATVTATALVAGHVLGSPHPDTRAAVAIATAMRNPGLALLVATQNRMPAAVSAAVIAYLAVSACLVLGYAAWQRRARRDTA